MYGQVYGCCIQGIQGHIVEVEVDIAKGLPNIHLVGLPDSAVRESVDRIRAAIHNNGFRFPQQRVTINLAPADLRKEGTAFDLAIAASVLKASGEVTDIPPRTMFIGELSLEGKVRSIPGVLPMVAAAKQAGFQQVVLPASQVAEAMLIRDIRIVPIHTLSDLRRLEHISLPEADTSESSENIDLVSKHGDFADVMGHHQAKRAAMIAAAGRHHMLMIGTPGSGKTMIARRMPTILPPLTEEEALESMTIYSVAGKLHEENQLMKERPFRAPHHTVSTAGMIGGGAVPKPGEVSLAHHGVLFLDELPEYSRTVLEVLRQPIEDGQVTIGRARMACTFPTKFLLVCSMNPCPCGFFGSRGPRTCVCTSYRREQYMSRVSGPLLDRIDLHVEMPHIEYAQLRDKTRIISSAEMRENIRVAEERQAFRYRNEAVRTNQELQGASLRKYCTLSKEAELLLRDYYDSLGLSIRAHDRILKIARTIADLEQCEKIDTPHLAEAIEYRVLDQLYISD